MQKQQLTTEIKQSLRLTTAIKQSINVLQMSSIELGIYVNNELEKNPFLEIELPEEDDAYIHDYGVSYTNKNSNMSTENDNDNALSNISQKKSLKEHVIEQLNLIGLSEKEKIIALYLTDMLDNNGYIKNDLTEVAKLFSCDMKIIEDCLTILQKEIGPSGLFARDLAECLLLQLEKFDDSNKSYAKKIISNLDLVGKNEIAKLAKICILSKPSVLEIIKKIKKLNPKPGLEYGSDNIQYKIPDVILLYSKNGDFKLEINQSLMPKLKVNKYLFVSAKSGLVQKDEKKYIREEMQKAENLMSAVERRANTMLKVVGYIVEKQIDFFKRGVLYFKPLVMRDIAELCEMNESTISRAIAHKYMSTPLGLYELKFFFSSSLDNKRGEENISSVKVKELIKSIIDCEDKDKILSDDDIADELKNFNINIARRTVAKYREAVKIPTSSYRKRMARSK